MTTTVTVRTHNREAKVQQIYTSGDSEPVTIPAESEMTFYVHTDMDILVFEEAVGTLEDDDAPVLDAEWFRKADHYQGETLIRKGEV